jgi:CubicO group peptidase (beta-lactamase class C family)
MRTKLCAVLLMALMLHNFSGYGFTQAPRTPLDFSEVERVLLAEMREENVPGASVVVVSGDRVVFSKGFGVANVETRAPVTPETLFQIGSITKPFTAAALLTLADEGKLKLDAPIGNYVKNLSPKLGQVSLHHLLSHTAGIKDEPDEYGGQDESMLASYLRSWTDDYVLFDAGEVFSYSNSGFALAGLTAQEVLGKPYADLMAEHVFQPLGMARTTFRPTVAMTYPLAVGHRARPGETPTVVRPLAQDARLYPAGTIYSNANEMARFVVALLNDGRLDGKQVFPRTVVGKMASAQAVQPSAGDGTGYGYGLFMNRERGVRRVWHDGSMTGYVGTMLMVPEHRFGVVILCNRDGGQLERTQEKVLELMLPLAPKEDFKASAAQPLSDAEMKRYVGTYEQPNRFKIEILIKEGKLFIKEFNNEMPLTKIGENRFAFNLPRAERPIEVYFKLGRDDKPRFLHQFVWAFKRLN